MSELMHNIDGRTRLAGTNKLEILMFSLGLDARSGRTETFGINVFKVREVMRAPEITRAPDMPDAVRGMVSLRGALVPVLDLVRYTGVANDAAPEVMIVTEYNGRTQGLLVAGVDTILRLDWSKMRVPPAMLAQKMGGLITAVTELGDGRLVMMMDVEKVLADAGGQEDQDVFNHLRPMQGSERTVFFADDSSTARKQIERTLDALGLRHLHALNGRQAWDDLQRLADQSAARGEAFNQHVHLVLTDVEMPEMDGYMLTKHIKSDPRFKGIPVLMHSSLSGESNHQLGLSVGVDGYVAKFEPQRLADTLVRMLA
ncbi:MAG: chemotaxis protein CheV [Proteobacteria bacterium]|nr:chemotaxis protein CheV [Burkholderiales bacterium]